MKGVHESKMHKIKSSYKGTFGKKPSRRPSEDSPQKALLETPLEKSLLKEEDFKKVLRNSAFEKSAAKESLAKHFWKKCTKDGARK